MMLNVVPWPGSDSNVISPPKCAFIVEYDINSLVQVINNMISNSIQAYAGKPEQKIDFIFNKNKKGNLIISIKDYGVF